MNNEVITLPFKPFQPFEPAPNSQEFIGWICPQCGRSIAPTEKFCPLCTEDTPDPNQLSFDFDEVANV